MHPKQYAYMRDLRRSLDVHRHCVLEMPSRTVKTVSVLSAIVPDQHRLMVCRRDVCNIDDSPFLGLGRSSRKNSYLHPSVRRKKKGKAGDAQCRDWDSAAAKAGLEKGEEIELCGFHENLNELDQDQLLPSGVRMIEDVKAYGACPDFAVRKMLRMWA
ncbi:hypothetical protein JCM6882_002391 [Rhodosporidiobolus microsporus]